VKYAKDKKCDLIVLGHSGHSRLWGHLLGHTADRVSEYASCSVLIVRTPTKPHRKRAR
jgi:nucleotide-binding universal stress UspA family protein